MSIWTPLEWLAMIGTVGAVGLLAGPVPALVVTLAVPVWYVLGLDYAVGVLWIATVPLDPWATAVIGAGSLVLVGAALLAVDPPSVAVAVAAAGVLGGIGYLGVTTVGTMGAGVALLATLAVLGYGVHRYELVALEVLELPPEGSA